MIEEVTSQIMSVLTTLERAKHTGRIKKIKNLYLHPETYARLRLEGNLFSTPKSIRAKITFCGIPVKLSIACGTFFFDVIEGGRR